MFRDKHLVLWTLSHTHTAASLLITSVLLTSLSQIKTTKQRYFRSTHLHSHVCTKPYVCTESLLVHLSSNISSELSGLCRSLNYRSLVRNRFCFFIVKCEWEYNGIKKTTLTLDREILFLEVCILRVTNKDYFRTGESFGYFVPFMNPPLTHCIQR